MACGGKGYGKIQRECGKREEVVSGHSVMLHCLLVYPLLPHYTDIITRSVLVLRAHEASRLLNLQECLDHL